MTAGRTNGTAQSANPPETDADVNRTALLGGEPAKRASGVDEGGRKVADVDEKAALGGELVERARRINEGNETEREHESQLQQTNCKANCQRNGNANTNVPKDYRSWGSGKCVRAAD